MFLIRKSIPWAPFGALILLALVELSVRTVGPDSYIAYERGPSARHAIRRHVVAFGSSELLIVGSSRVEMGIDCPLMRQGLEAKLKRPIEVSNYALGGAQAAESVPMVMHVLRHEPRPRVILYGVGKEQIGPNDLVLDPSTQQLVREPIPVNERSAMFWNMEDFIEAREQFGSVVDQYLPIVLRNGIEQHYQTLRVRGRTMNAIRNRLRGREGSPILGESLDVGDREISMAKDGYDALEIRQHVEGLHLVDGSYPFHEQRLTLFRQLVDRCKETNTLLVFVELPNSAVYEAAFPSDTQARFRQVFDGFAAQQGVEFLTLADLGLQDAFDHADFYDAVHLNLQGAERYTFTIAERLADVITWQ